MMVKIPGADQLGLVATQVVGQPRASAAAFGSLEAQAMGQTAAGMREAGRAAFDVGLKMREEDDDAAIKLADAKMSQRLRERLYEPETGFFNQQGRGAIDGYKPLLGDLNTIRDEVAGELNDRQRTAFMAIAERRVTSAADEATRYVGRERKSYLVSAGAARVESAINDAIASPYSEQNVRANVAIARDEAASLAMQRGEPPEAVKLAAEKAESEAYMRTIRARAANDPVGALQFFENNRPRIVGDVYGFERELRAQSNKRQAELIADQAFSGGIEDKIIWVESGGNAAAKAATSSATGTGQFINSTWLDVVKRNAPDVAQGKSDAEILALRTDPALSRRMVAAHASENREALRKEGLPVDDGAVYLAHFAGIDGAKAILTADRGKPISNVMSAQAIDANAWLKGKTVGEVQDWARRKMSGGPASAGGLSQAIAQVQNIADPDLRDRATAEIRQRYSLMELQRKEAERAIEDDVWRQAVSPDVMSVNQIDPARLAAMSGEGQRKIYDYMERKAKGATVVETPDTLRNYDRIIGMSFSDDPTVRQEFLSMDVGALYTAFPKDRVDRVLSRRAEMMRSDEKAAQKDADVARAKRVIGAEALAAGVKMSGKRSKSEIETAALFEGQLFEALQEFQAREKRPPKEDEILKIGRGLLVKGRVEWALWDSSRMAFEAKGAGEVFVVTFDDVPRQDAEQAAAALQRALGRPATEAEIVAAYKRKMGLK